MAPGPASRKCTPYLLAGPGGMPLALRLSEGLGRNAGKTLGIDTILDLLLAHVEEDMPVVLVLVLGVEAKCSVIAHPRC